MPPAHTNEEEQPSAHWLLPLMLPAHGLLFLIAPCALAMKLAAIAPTPTPIYVSSSASPSIQEHGTGCLLKAAPLCSACYFLYALFMAACHLPPSFYQVYDCHTVEDRSWLRADMAVPCGGPMHIAVAMLTSVWLCGWGLVVPSAVMMIGRREYADVNAEVRVGEGRLEECAWQGEGTACRIQHSTQHTEYSTQNTAHNT